MNKENIALLAITGSKAYGLDHAASDTDKMGIFIADTIDVAGLNWSQSDESWSDAGPTGDDTTLHEMGKFLKLVLKCNPTLIELLWMNEYEILDNWGKDLVDRRDAIVYTKGIRNHYHGYAYSQLARVRADYPNHKPKMARHTLRIARQGAELLKTGTFDVKVPDPEEYFALDNLSFDELDEKISRAVTHVQLCDSVLPDAPDRDIIAEYLEDVRIFNIGPR
ncbi:nucleotidyl transferase [Arthrobacter phage Atuin]|nr:nucleotidyl transferase [Arthrobacter phage Atuin]